MTKVIGLTTGEGFEIHVIESSSPASLPFFNRSHGCILRGVHFVAASNNLIPRSRASGIFLTYLLCVTPMLECRNSSLAANASPVSSVKTVAAPLRPAYSPFHCRPFAFSVGAMVNLTRVFRSRGNTRSLSPAF